MKPPVNRVPLRLVLIGVGVLALGAWYGLSHRPKPEKPPAPIAVDVATVERFMAFLASSKGGADGVAVRGDPDRRPGPAGGR